MSFSDKALFMVSDLKVGFENSQQSLVAVKDVSFSIKQGETLALVGESGCGKSITAAAIARLLPKNAFYGQDSEIKLEQLDLLELPEALMKAVRGKRLALIFQEPMTALNPVLTIETQLLEAIQDKQGVSKKALQVRLIHILKEVDIPQPEIRLKQYPHQLSGGQRQRVVIAMALLNQPELLIADEPTTALDVTVQAQILELLARLQRQYQMSLLLITHDLTVVKRMAHRVCVMYAGQIVEMAEAEAFFQSPKHPYVHELFAAIPSFSKRGHRLQVIPGKVPGLDERPTGCTFHPRCPHVFAKCHSVMPTLQTVGHHEVRCHLYPDIQSLPHHVQSAVSLLPPSQASQIILKVNALSVQYPEPKRSLFAKRTYHQAVDGISFDLKKGQTTALVGESGCGKTTVSRAILRLLPKFAGSIQFLGQEVAQLKGQKLKDFRQKVQILFQDPFSSLNPRLTVKEILEEGCLYQNRKNKTQAHLMHLLDKVGLPQNALSRYPHQFSGGQRSRIGLARALATAPELLVCDEPTSSLDVSIQAQILNLLKTLQHEEGLSYLFITHNMSVVSYMADEVLVMQAGKMVERGDCEAILYRPQHPYTQQLLASVLTIE